MLLLFVIAALILNFATGMNPNDPCVEAAAENARLTIPQMRIGARLFESGLNSEGSIAGYMAIDRMGLEELLRGRILLFGRDRALDYRVLPTHQHRVGREQLIRLKVSDADSQLHSRKKLIQKAEVAATRLTALQIVRSRLREADASPEAYGHLPSILYHFRSDLSRGGRLSFLSFLQALQKSTVPKLEMSEAVIENLRKRRDPSIIGAYRQFATFASWVGGNSQRFDTDAPLQRRVLGLFSDLPVKAGYVLAIRPVAVQRLPAPDSDERFELSIKDLSGIEPVGQFEFDRLLEFQNAFR